MGIVFIENNLYDLYLHIYSYLQLLMLKSEICFFFFKHMPLTRISKGFRLFTLSTVSIVSSSSDNRNSKVLNVKVRKVLNVIKCLLCDVVRSHVTCPPVSIGASLKFTAQKFYPHGDGGHPGFWNDSDVAGKNRRVDVVFYMVAVICISQENLQ